MGVEYEALKAELAMWRRLASRRKPWTRGQIRAKAHEMSARDRAWWAIANRFRELRPVAR